VIGNGAYQNVPQLANPVNDANDVAAALKRDGFDTILATDLDKDHMDDATIRFAKAARTADVAMFYYSGHAMQFAGVNYLAPVDAKLTDEADLRRMVRVDEIVSDLQQAKNLRILVLDSCRDNPLADQLKRSIGATRAIPLQRGLAKIDTPLGMIVSFSTQAGTEAADGSGRNSPYTAAFLKEIEKQDEIGTIFRRISSDVYTATDHRQLPELSLSLIGEFYLRGKADVSISTSPASPPPPSPPPVEDTTRSDFDAAERVDTVGGWDAFLSRHPDGGFYADLARERRNTLQQPKVTMVTPVPSPTPAPPIENNDHYLAIAITHNGAWGAVNAPGESTREEAENAAMESCGRFSRRCRKVAWTRNGCIALARGIRVNGAMGWSGTHTDVEDARKEALVYCAKNDPRGDSCKVVWSACAN
jgi:hypothetical protein